MGWRDEDNSNNRCAPASDIPHLLLLHQESANCLFPFHPHRPGAGQATHIYGCCPSSDENLAQLLEKSRKIPSSQKHVSPIELNVKNQQPILPGKQQTSGRQNYKENRGKKKTTTEEKVKLCQSQRMMRRKKALLRITVGGCSSTL